MRMLRSKLEQRRRAALALTTGEGLLVRLNNAPQPRRIRELVELVHTLQEIERIEADPEHAPNRLYVQANKLLSAYHWIPCVFPRPHNPPCSFIWNASDKESDWENNFVSWILNLRERGDISLIRSCRNCKGWFYAVTNHQFHCSDRCRQHLHSRDASFKEKRRLYMRRYRKAEKLRDLAAKKSLATGRRIADARPRPHKKKGDS